MATLSTFLARVSDSMILVATTDTTNEAEEYKSAAKRILKTLKPGSPSRCTIEAGPYYYHYIIENGVCYLTLAERGYPRSLAYSYLEEIAKQFHSLHGAEVHRYSRPYAAISFDPRINKIRREFLDPQSPANIRKLNSELVDIHNIMSANIQEVLQRGEKLDVMSEKSATLMSESKKFEKLSRYINLQALWRSYGPVAAVGLVVILVIYLRFFR